MIPAHLKGAVGRVAQAWLAPERLTRLTSEQAIMFPVQFVGYDSNIRALQNDNASSESIIKAHGTVYFRMGSAMDMQ